MEGIHKEAILDSYRDTDVWFDESEVIRCTIELLGLHDIGHTADLYDTHVNQLTEIVIHTHFHGDISICNDIHVPAIKIMSKFNQGLFSPALGGHLTLKDCFLMTPATTPV